LILVCVLSAFASLAECLCTGSWPIPSNNDLLRVSELPMSADERGALKEAHALYRIIVSWKNTFTMGIGEE
jgi:hypothetical protein